MLLVHALLLPLSPCRSCYRFVPVVICFAFLLTVFFFVCLPQLRLANANVEALSFLLDQIFHTFDPNRHELMIGEKSAGGRGGMGKGAK